MNPPHRRESPQVMLAAMWAGGAAYLVIEAAAEHEAGEYVSPWTWVMVALLAGLALLTYEWDAVWRALHPPMRFDPETLPLPFDWWEVDRRMSAYYDTEEYADASPEESDGVYLATHDAVTLGYVDVVREILAQYDGTVSWHPVEPELGTDRSGRACFVGCKDVFKLDPPVVLPSPHRNGLMLVDRVDAEARLQDDGPWRWTVMHGRVIDRTTGEVDDRADEFYTAPGVADLYGPRDVIGA